MKNILSSAPADEKNAKLRYRDAVKRRRALWTAAALASGVILSAQQPDLDILKIRDNVYMIAAAGANITVQFGGDGAVVVDAGTGPQADAVIAAIKKITPQPIRYVIDTSDDGDHVGGYNARYGASSGAWTTNMFVEAIYNSLRKGSR